MPIFAVRVWLPDRPGALGAVATRIGAARGDVIGIDIIERGAGRAVDELTIDLPQDGLVDLMVAEIREVEGVDVEDVRPLAGTPVDPAVAALEVALEVRGAFGELDVHEFLVSGAFRLLHADWSAVVDLGKQKITASIGAEVPSDAWLCAFVLGAMAEGGPADLDELAIAPIQQAKQALVVGRGHLPLRGRERAILEGLAALA